ncbi:MAG: hypothetical protein DMG82_06370 [Acidobacteria bacterium]|nr:MAG: hypothetical protein DMG82_06370 [Acidobacteriota bacterium]
MESRASPPDRTGEFTYARPKEVQFTIETQAPRTSTPELLLILVSSVSLSKIIFQSLVPQVRVRSLDANLGIITSVSALRSFFALAFSSPTASGHDSCRTLW